MQTTIHVAHLQTYGYHGMFAEERRLGQRFCFDIEAKLSPGRSHRADDLEGSVRYDAMIDAVVLLAGEAEYQTLEALGEAIAVDLLERFPPIESVAIGVSKSSPPIPQIVKHVGVTIRLSRADLQPL